VLAVRTLEFSHRSHFKFTSFNLECLAFDQRLGHLFMCRFDNPSEGLAGNLHPLRGLLLIKTLKVSKPDRFTLVNRQNDFFQHGKRDTPWFKVIAFRDGTHSPAISRPCHLKLLLSELIISICS
jgi:hypothetical protein